MSRRYTVDLDALQGFTDRLAKFNARAEQIAAAVDQCVAELHGTWLGDGADGEQQYHQKWMEVDTQMREGLDELRRNTQVAHRNYTGVAQLNTTMWA